mmetsp:Transcript_26953/g.54213  ORF Transcript_26953/g.54213 Transcript_26953/m.54213 type:complete len:288 (-) Transcript_26953:615-1478(-)
MPLLHRPERVDARHAAVLRQRHRDRLQRVGERAHRVLVDARHRLGRVHDRQVARDLRRAPAVHDPIVTHEVADDAEAVVDGALDLLDDHLVGAAHKDRHRLAVLAVLHKQHPVLGRPKRHLPHPPRRPQLLCRQLREARHDARPARDGKKLDLHPAHPPHSGQLVLHEEVVCLVVEAPLADGEVRATVLDLLHHVHKVLLLLLVQSLVLLDGVDGDVVLGLGFGRLERTRQDAEPRVLDVLHHAGMTDVLVQHDTVHQLRVFHLPPSLALHLDEVQVHIFPLEVRNS